MFEDFTFWASENGVKTSATVIHQRDGQGRTLRSSKFLKKGETILHCPANLTVTCDSVIETTVVGEYLRKNPRSLDPMQTLMAYLIFLSNKLGIDNSPFLQSLPKYFDLPIFWNETLLSCFPPEMSTKFTKRQNYVNQTVERLCKISKFASFEVSNNSLMHAFCCVNTRCFYVKEQFNDLLDCTDVQNNMILVPYLDMCNHRASSPTDYYVTDGGCDIIAKSDIEEDVEITLSYGVHSNYELIIEYGFFYENNPHDFVLLCQSDFLSSLQNCSEVFKCSEPFLEMCKKDLFFISHGQPSWALISFLSAINTNDFDYFFNQYFSGQLGFPRKLKLLKNICEFKLNQYKQLVDQLMRGEGARENECHFSILKQFLQSRIDMIEEVEVDLELTDY